MNIYFVETLTDRSLGLLSLVVSASAPLRAAELACERQRNFIKDGATFCVWRVSPPRDGGEGVYYYHSDDKMYRFDGQSFNELIS